MRGASFYGKSLKGESVVILVWSFGLFPEIQPFFWDSKRPSEVLITESSFGVGNQRIAENIFGIFGRRTLQIQSGPLDPSLQSKIWDLKQRKF